MGAVDQAEVDPMEMDPEMAMADTVDAVEDQAEAMADVAEQVVVMVDTAEPAEADKTANANKVEGTTAVQCRTCDAITVGTEIT